MKTILYAAAAALLALPAVASADDYCGKLHTNHYGPFDYRTEKSKLIIVENAHFTPEVERGEKGNTDYIGGDLDYTLQSSPNHHKALATLARVALRDKAVKLRASRYPVECYFERAQRFTPDDGNVRAIYGSYLFALGRIDDALAAYKAAVVLEPDNAMINYNLGLTYLKKHDFEHANLYAHKAYDIGYPLPGLKNQLVKAGKWADPAK